MVKPTTLSDFHEMQRGELYADQPIEQPAELDPLSGLMAEQADRATRVMAGAKPHLGLLALNIGAQCTAEMSLSMIRARVIEASSGRMETPPTDQEIQDEAERIWTSFTDNGKKGPREHTYTVNGGQVADWREVVKDRAETEPYEPTVHHVGEDGERFSGGGTTDGETVQGSMFLVPTDAQFRGKDYQESGELFQLAQKLIGEHGILDHLKHCSIRYFWRRKTGVLKGQRITGALERASGLKGHLLGGDFAIWLAADTARERQASDRRIERWMFRQLRRIGQDDKGNYIDLPFTLQVFAEEIVHYADVGDEDLKVGHSAFKNADQMGLFSDDAEDEDDDEEPDDSIGMEGDGALDDEVEGEQEAEYTNAALQAVEDLQAGRFDAPAEGDPLADVEPII